LKKNSTFEGVTKEKRTFSKSETEEMPQKETYSIKKSKSESSSFNNKFSDFRMVSITVEGRRRSDSNERDER
jgi:hypothetical protein